MGQLHGLLKIGNAATLRASLEDAFFLLYRFGQLLAGGNGDTARLFAVHVFAGFRRQNRGRRVPAVAGSNNYGIDIFAIEQFAEIAEENAVVVFVVSVNKFL